MEIGLIISVVLNILLIIVMLWFRNIASEQYWKRETLEQVMYSFVHEVTLKFGKPVKDILEKVLQDKLKENEDNK